MILRPYKFLIVPVIQAVDEGGRVLREQQADQPDVVFGVDGLADYAARFETALAEAAKRAEGAGDGD